jgi:hypothetical protein
MVVVKWPTLLELKGVPNPSAVGEPVTFTATLTDSWSFGTLPTGSMIFAVDQPEDEARQHPVSVDASGVATWTTSDLALGHHQIYATYLGDANFAPTWVHIEMPAGNVSTGPAMTTLSEQSDFTKWVGLEHSVEAAFTGFFQPIDNPGDPITFNRVNAGRALPVRFSLGGDQGLDIFAVGSPSSVKVTMPSGAATDPIEETATWTPGNSELSYDATADLYTYVWKTDKVWAGTQRKLVVTLIDGSTHVAFFSFTN